MRFILIFLITALLFLLGTVLIMDAQPKLGEGWYLVPTPDSWR